MTVKYALKTIMCPQLINKMTDLSMQAILIRLNIDVENANFTFFDGSGGDKIKLPFYQEEH